MKMIRIITILFLYLFNFLNFKFKNNNQINLRKTTNINATNLLTMDNKYPSMYDGIYEIKDFKFDGEGEYKIGFHFANEIEDFKIATRNKKLGFKISLKRNNYLFDEEYLYSESKFQNLFYKTNNNYYFKKKIYSDLNMNVIGLKYYKTFLLEINFKANYLDEIKSFKLIYSDTPVIINKVYIARKNVDYQRCINDNNEFINDKNRFNILTNNKENLYLNCEYGRILSFNYLRKKYVFYDNELSKYIFLNEIIDDNNYFIEGNKLSIGSTAKIILKTLNKELEIVLTVLDSLPPIITPLKENVEINCSYKTNFNDASFIYKYFNIEDNFTKNNKIYIKDINNNVVINKVGKVNAKLIAKDDFNNESEYIFKLNLIDDIKPVITAKYKIINLNETIIFNEEEIIEMFSAYDEIDKTCKINIKDNSYINNETKEGKHFIEVLAKDSSSNEENFKLIINVKKGGSVFYANENYLTFQEGQNIKDNEIIEALIEMEQIEKANYKNIIFPDNKKLSEYKEGMHDLNLVFEKENNQKIETKLIIEVTKNDDKKDEKKLTIIDKIINFFKSIFEKIKNLFK